MISELSFAGKVRLEKYFGYPNKIKKHHPVEKYFSGTRKFDLNKRNSGRLLVLLIDFVEDDNTQTTGNGKFLQDATGYHTSLGCPPHNYEFFVEQMEALRYYYLAVSLGFYEVDYDIFPVSNANFTAFTLPHEMAYYNPPNASSDLMVSRFEEYFYDSFAAADASGTIDFSQYDNFMLLHAGSDWQHDILSDSPSDIPSFFIRLATGKEYVTSNNDTIRYACNVPEMITQDISETITTNGDVLIDGYALQMLFMHMSSDIL